jgi:hypothetical protein
MDPYRHIEIERIADVFVVRLRQSRLEEAAVYECAEELLRLAREGGCRKLLLSMSPPPECLYSVFLARLIAVQRHLRALGGALKICDANHAVLSIFDACKLGDCFEFVPDRAAGLAQFGVTEQ